MLEHILLPLDGSALAERVLPHAVALSEAFGSRLTLLRVVYQEQDANCHSIVNPMDWQMRKTEAESYLRSVQQRLEQVEIDSEIQIIEGKPANQIIEYAKQNDVQLIMMSSHGSSGVSEWNINSTVQKVLLRALMPVMIIRAYQEVSEDLKGLTYQRLLLPLDGSKRAECILPLAESICSVQNSKIILAHIVEEPSLPHQTPLSDENQGLIDRLKTINLEDAKNYMSQLKEQLHEENVDMIIESSIKPTITLHNIVDKEEVDLVLLSAHGYSGDNRWPYGKITLNFIAYGTTPLIIVQDLTRDEVSKSMAELYAEQSKGH
jgi:nucleotide-binding universal stress UspA family protein